MTSFLVLAALLLAVAVAVVDAAWLGVLSRRQRILATRLALHVCRDPDHAHRTRHTGRHARN